MTDEQKYMELLKSLGELLADNSRIIRLANYEIETLKTKLEDAEATIEELKKGKSDGK